MQLRRMADASLALAERRRTTSSRPSSASGRRRPAAASSSCCASWGCWRRRPARVPRPGPRIAIILAIVVVLLLLGWGIVELVALPFGGVSTAGGLLLGVVVIALILGVLALVGRRRQARAKGRAQAARS
jgi:hypothetical protein